MTTIFQTNYEVDLENHKIFVQRNFNAPLDLVWRAWTEKEILDEWWAPRPWQSKTTFMNFEEGGKRVYAMVSPEGQEFWSVQKYISISAKSNFKMFNAFADKDENLQLPGSDWDISFSEENGTTKLSVEIYNESLERMQQMIEMGFQGGFAMAHNNLDEVLEKMK
jgi:uncharacterized protein YndB with AHSA1/START domain